MLVAVANGVLVLEPWGSCKNKQAPPGAAGTEIFLHDWSVQYRGYFHTLLKIQYNLGQCHSIGGHKGVR